ncbi:MAG: class IV adenylate cyclase [Patescibacteria group bacterium]|nr:class IV adenylate cyclase [Patescibacteria group bacterium]
MREVEILVEVYDALADAKQKLAKFSYHGDKKTIDVYYVDPLRSALRPTEHNELKEVFRLREKDGACFLAYKVNHYDSSDIWTYSDEHEVEVSDFRTAENIIEHLGFKTLVEIRNVKHTYTTDRFEIVLEEVENLGTFLEVERHSISDSEDIIDAKKEIWDFIKNLEIKVSDELHEGKPELMLKKIQSI